VKILDCHQGSPEWHAARAKHFTASEAPAAAGVSKYTTRSELLHVKATGIAPEPTEQKQELFDKGHAAERASCPIAEEVIGDILFPRTATVEIEGLPLLASLDGMTEPMSPDEPRVLWENKLWSEALAEEVRAGQLSPHYTLQLDQQQLVTGARRTLFMVSDGTRERTLWCWYESTPEKRAALLAVWRQFKADLAAYVPHAIVEPAVAPPTESLPAISVRVDGALAVVSNLDRFSEALRAFVDRIPKKPTTDEDFAAAEEAVKRLKLAEEALSSARQQAISGVASVEELTRTIADLEAVAKSARLATDKLVQRRKDEIREEIAANARRAFLDHTDALDAEIAPARLGMQPPDFGGAMKNKRTLASLRDAVDTALANGKIEADAKGKAIRGRLAWYRENVGEAGHLFADLGVLLHKADDDFRLVVQTRLDAETERLRKVREAAEAAAPTRLMAVVETGTQITVGTAAPPVAPFRPGAAAAAALAPATLNLGDVCSRLGFTVTSAFLADALHVKPAKVDRRASLYTEEQFALICRQLVSHISAMAELYAPVEA
jgi:predicted phage-related endonuclease